MLDPSFYPRCVVEKAPPNAFLPEGSHEPCHSRWEKLGTSGDYANYSSLSALSGFCWFAFSGAMKCCRNVTVSIGVLIISGGQQLIVERISLSLTCFCQGTGMPDYRGTFWREEFKMRTKILKHTKREFYRSKRDFSDSFHELTVKIEKRNPQNLSGIAQAFIHIFLYIGISFL